MDPVHLVHPGQDPEPCIPGAAVGKDWLAGSFPPEVRMSPVEVGGTTNGRQPARQVALRTPLGAGSRR